MTARRFANPTISDGELESRFAPVFDRIAAGTVDRDVLDGAAARLRDACVESRIPYALLDTAPADHAAWLNAATDAVESVLEQR